MSKSAAGPQRRTSNGRDDHNLLFQAWSCAFADLHVTYVSGPITTGPRFVQWYQEEGHRLVADTTKYEPSHRAKVIEPNELEVLAVARQLRGELREPVVEPASLRVIGWSQADYVTLWERFIESHAGKLVMVPGWQFSSGCAAEFLRACEHAIPIEAFNGGLIKPSEGLEMLRAAAETAERLRVPIPNLALAAAKLERYVARRTIVAPATVNVPLRKDASLDRLAETINVAQFVSFEPGLSPKQAYARVLGHLANECFPDARSAIETLLRTSAEASVNVRSFTPDSPLSREFIYGLTSVEEAVAAVGRLGAQGLFTIVNETVDVKDGGVSGVAMGGVIEFAPDDTPRCVEKPGTASLPRNWGIRLLSSVYRFLPDLDVPFASRLEFSLHPLPRGWRNTHTLGWEFAAIDPPQLQPMLAWPNRFSRMIGDKVFGLLVAHHLGLPVPQSTVINRRLAPFSFGEPTGHSEVWLRTAPSEQVPGKFTTTPRWTDPFALLGREDPGGQIIVSVIAQAAVGRGHSGAAVVAGDGRLVIEGKSGEGETLMRGQARPEKLPSQVGRDVETLFRQANDALGPVRFEWVHDGQRAWIVQLHRGAVQSMNKVLVPGQAVHWRNFNVADGLERLREVLDTIEPGEGLLLLGAVGLTSHIADVIRRAGVPARMV
jgi:hypothetical protein